MRSLHKSWQSDRPMVKTTRRMRWYQGGGSDSIRIKYDDQYGEASRFYATRASAQFAWDWFIANEGLRSLDVVRGDGSAWN